MIEEDCRREQQPEKASQERGWISLLAQAITSGRAASLLFAEHEL